LNPAPRRVGPRPRAPEAVIAISGALWGLYWIPVRYLEDRGVGVVWMTLGFFLVALALFVPVLVRHSLVRAVFTPRMLVTGLLTGGAFVLYTVSLVLTEVVTAILLFYLSPVWATALGRVLLAERLTASRLTALILGLGGLWVVLGGESGVPLPRNLGDWCALTAGVAWAFGSLRVHQDAAVSPIAHTAALFVGGTMVLAILALLPALQAPLPAVTPPAAAIVLVVAVLSALTAGGILWGARLISPGRAGLLMMMEVITGLASAALLAGEPFGMVQVVGSTLIMAAALVEVLPATRRPRA